MCQQVGGGVKGAKNPGGVEGTKEHSSQPTTGKEAESKPEEEESGDDASDGDSKPQAEQGGDDEADGGDEEDEDDEPHHDITVQTVPFDPRFPGVNQVGQAEMLN